MMTIRTRQGRIRSRARLAAAALAAVAVIALPVDAAAAPTPSPSASTVARAGTSFRTAVLVSPGQSIQVDASTGDYLYWSFTATAGQIIEISLSIALPPAEKRSGPSTWTVDVFDGMRRRQACTAGAQTPIAAVTDAKTALGCTLRRIRSWAEPWSDDPLPGTYYVRLSVIDLPENDLGLPTRVNALVSATDGGTSADDGDLHAALVPPAKPGKAASGAGPADPSASPSPSPDEGIAAFNWLPGLSARWVWTIIGGILAAVAGVVGFSLTWRRRRHI
ncbi:peptidase [Dactylosporangium sp. NPDC000555]|uniref:peptidase n=1 Tax=Dactylosporangium sp. NPDC000555 TaxID=3154260 RepID=UPI003319B073